MSVPGLDTFVTPIPLEGHQGLHRVVEELAQKSGITTPKLYTSTGADFMLTVAPAMVIRAKGEREPFLLLNPEAINHILGNAVNFADHAAIPKELEGVIAHEMGHIKRGDHNPLGMGNIAKITPLACAVGAIAGLYMLRSYLAGKDKAHAKLPSSQEAEEKLKLPAKIKSPTLEAAKKVALYVVAAAAGLTVGSYASKAMFHHMEYSCDAFSKKIMGSGKPLARFLEKTAPFCEEIAMLLVERFPANQREFRYALYKTLEAVTHPQIPKRIDALLR